MKTAHLDEGLALEETLALDAARRGLLGFAGYVYHGFSVNWHHRLICRAINYMYQGRTPRELLASWGIRGKALEALLAEPHPMTGLYGGMTSPAMIDEPIRNLQIALPPRHTKSLLVSVSLPGWWLGQNPNSRIISATYGSTLSEEHSADALRLMSSDHYRTAFPNVRLGQASDSSNVLRAKVTRTAFDVAGYRGKYRATSVTGALTGLSSDLAIVDDPHKDREEADSLNKREKVWRWYTSTLYTRGQKGVRRIVAATRWSDDDLSARLLLRAKQDPLADQWFCVVLPAILDCAPGPGDPRKMGEALWPEQYPISQLKTIRATQGAYEFEALYQQRPSPQEGGIVKDSWWQFYDKLPTDLTDWTLSVDLSFKDKNDFNCFQVWAVRKADRYLVDMVMERVEFTEQLRIFRMLCDKWPQCRVKLVEEAANGAALIDTLKRSIQGIIPVKPLGSKYNRAAAVAPQIEAGNVYLPSPKLRPWVEDFLGQWRGFGAGATHDDAVDAASQFLARMKKPAYELTMGMPLTVGKKTMVPLMPRR